VIWFGADQDGINGYALMYAALLSFLATLPREGAFASWILAGANRVRGGAGNRLQRGLVAVQIAVSVVLLAGAGLLTRTMISLADVDTGLRTEEVLTLQVPLLTPTELLTNPQADAGAKDRYRQIRDEVAALPGVIAVGLGSPMPLRRSDVAFEVKVEGRALDVGEGVPRAELRTADPEFFLAAGIPLLKGRSFATTDVFGSWWAVVINQTMADKYFPDDNPIGRRIAWTGEVLRFTAVIIAGVGIAGVLAFSVSARTNEIGIRVSLGADGGRVQRMILREGGVLLATGLVLGVVAALLAAGVIRALLFGVTPYDPVTFTGVALMMAAIGIIACWIPAVRASRIDPAITMRS
jgi:hypothetical protein